jgi:hypothetical protein
MATKEEEISRIEYLLNEYEYEMAAFYRSRFIHLVFLLLTFIVGYILFLKILKKRKRLRIARQEINEKIDMVSKNISSTEYLEFKSRVIKARRC